MKRWRFLAVLPLLLLAACGFHPLYGTDGTSPGVASELAAVSIADPTSRLTQLIRNDLLSSMRPAGTAEPDRYKLDIEATSIEDKSLEDPTNSHARRATVRVMANFTLRDISGGKLLYNGKTFSNVSYDDVSQSFSDLQARTNALERGAHEIALDIRTRLAAHFAAR